MSSIRPGDEGVTDRALRYKEFYGGTVAEAFARASTWLSRNDGAIGVQDVGLHHLHDLPDPWEIVIYFHPE